MNFNWNNVYANIFGVFIFFIIDFLLKIIINKFISEKYKNNVNNIRPIITFTLLFVIIMYV